MALPIILGIESSCDETAAAVVRGGEELLSNVVFSQIAAHQRFGGVVPEIASREHLRGIVPVVRLALEQAKQTYDSIDAIAVTQGPGLAGALLVGVTYAKALAFAQHKPVIAVNHLEGHIQVGHVRFEITAGPHLGHCRPVDQQEAEDSQDRRHREARRRRAQEGEHPQQVHEKDVDE